MRSRDTCHVIAEIGSPIALVVELSPTLSGAPMFKGFSRLASCAAFVAATLAPMAAHAVVIDFNDPDLVGLYSDGDTFTQNGFQMKTEFDPGTVDTVAGFLN